MKTSVDTKCIVIEAKGAQLVGRYTPPSGAMRANLVIHPATGVPQRYYRHFAEWAARRGIGTLTYDYRDFGESLRRPMRESEATFADWLIHDQAAADRALARLAPEGPLWVLGHSAGGLGLVFRDLDPRVERVTTIGAGMAHVSDHPWAYLPIVLAFWYLVGPVGTSVAGYLPGRRLLLGADLPANVYWQWRRWCTRRDFFRGDIGTSLPAPNFELKGPQLRMMTMTDDVVVPPAAVRRYANTFPPDRVAFETLCPSDYGLPALRHIEAFSKQSAPAWSAILNISE